MFETYKGLTFLHPELFVCGTVCMVAAVIMCASGYSLRKSMRAVYGEAKLIEAHSPPLSLRREVYLCSAWVLILACLCIAAAAPVVESGATRVAAGTVEVVVVSDVSRSMAAEEHRAFMPPREGVSADLVPGPYGSRLDYVKLNIVSHIMPALNGNRLGVVTYSGLGFIQSELTEDFSALRWILRHWMPIGGAPGDGSDFASGITQALSLFNPDDSRTRVIVLFSDGGFTGSEESMQQAVADLRRLNVRLIVVGVGGNQPAPIPQYSRSGESLGYLQREGQTVLTAFEEPALERLRTLADAQYIRLAPGETLSIDWASELGGSRVEIGQRHLFVFPLLAALFIVFLLACLGLFNVRDVHQLRKERL